MKTKFTKEDVLFDNIIMKVKVISVIKGLIEEYNERKKELESKGINSHPSDRFVLTLLSNSIKEIEE